jgi:hypothetical protein
METKKDKKEHAELKKIADEKTAEIEQIIQRSKNAKKTEFLGRIEPVNIRGLTPRFFIRSKTNDKEPAKQYFVVLISDTTEPTLLIKKRVLSDNFKLYQDYEIIKKFKDYALFESYFSIKLSTINTVMGIVNMFLNQLKK